MLWKRERLLMKMMHIWISNCHLQGCTQGVNRRMNQNHHPQVLKTHAYLRRSNQIWTRRITFELKVHRWLWWAVLFACFMSWWLMQIPDALNAKDLACSMLFVEISWSDQERTEFPFKEYTWWLVSNAPVYALELMHLLLFSWTDTPPSFHLGSQNSIF